MTDMLVATLISCFAGCTIVAAISDVRELRVPNRLCATIGLLFIGYAVVALDLRAAGLAAAIGGLTLAVGFGLFSRGWLGGGDVKLLSVAALWAGPAHAFDLFAVTAVAGGALALALGSPLTSPLTIGLQQRWQRVAPAGQSSPMPCAVAIATGALVVAAQLFAA